MTSQTALACPNVVIKSRSTLAVLHELEPSVGIGNAKFTWRDCCGIK